MRIIENTIGYADEYGNQLAYKPEFAFMNYGRKEEFKKPIWKKQKGECEGETSPNRSPLRVKREDLI